MNKVDLLETETPVGGRITRRFPDLAIDTSLYSRPFRVRKLPVLRLICYDNERTRLLLAIY